MSLRKEYNQLFRYPVPSLVILMIISFAVKHTGLTKEKQECSENTYIKKKVIIIYRNYKCAYFNMIHSQTVSYKKLILCLKSFYTIIKEFNFLN